MPVDDVDDSFELIGRERVERMRVRGVLCGARLRLGPQAGQLLTAILLTVWL
jgi:hypothetical protein